MNGGVVSHLSAMTVSRLRTAYEPKRATLGEIAARGRRRRAALEEVSRSKKSIGALIMDQSASVAQATFIERDPLQGAHPPDQLERILEPSSMVWRHSAELLQRGFREAPSSRLILLMTRGTARPAPLRLQ